MPKRRSSSAVSSGGAGGAVGAGAGIGSGSVAGSASGVPVGMSGPFTVEAYSRTRRQAESVQITFDNNDTALVGSGSGNTYRVTYGDAGESCTCTDFEQRGSIRPCRHIESVRNVLRGARFVEAPTPDDAAAGTGGNARSEAVEAFDRSAALAAEVLADQTDAECSLVNDEETFQELYQKASAGDMPYEYENVLNGSRNTFGVEIEFVGGDRRAIARELYQKGLIPSPSQGFYHAGRFPGLWAFELDGSVDGEVVSPVLRDNPEAWKQIEEVCEVIRRHGGRVDPRCGGHVHIGKVPLDHNDGHWNRLINLCRNNEDLLYRIASGGDSRGSHRGTHYTVPLTWLSTELTYNDLQRRSGYYPAVSNRTATVEFRYFNGTLDPRQIQANVRLAHALVNASANPDTRVPDTRRILGDTARGRTPDENHNAVRNFLDTVFTRARDKVSSLWLYATSQWQSA